jgi:hypothetical protein
MEMSNIQGSLEVLRDRFSVVYRNKIYKQYAYQTESEWHLHLIINNLHKISVPAGCSEWCQNHHFVWQQTFKGYSHPKLEPFLHTDKEEANVAGGFKKC